VTLATAALALSAGLAAALLPSGQADAAPATTTTTSAGAPDVTPAPLPPTPPVSSCPWLQTAMAQHRSPGVLANLVLARMTLTEKLGEVVLASTHGYENANTGVSRLCIPSLTLQDGPAGLAYGDTDVTQLPAPLALAATFDTSLARQYGMVLGSEARGQGIDVLQSPNLNIDRVPQSGRGYEGFGEDPLLVSAMGVAEIDGIQSQGTLAQAKHFVAYDQETNRGELDTVVSPRALQEIYLRPFKAAVQQAHVASIMCAYPQLNDVFQCQDPTLTQILHGWGFTGFIRSDLGAVHSPVTALGAGTDLIKPATVARLARSVHEGLLPVASVNSAVRQILSTMFANGLVGRTSTGSVGTPVDTLSHGLLARQVAERSAVLLKNRRAVLPLSSSPSSSVAVIGADASAVPVTTGFGSSYVTADFTSTPLAAIRRQVGAHTVVRYVDGGSTTHPYPSIPSQFLAPSTGTGHGLTLTVAPSQPSGSAPLQMLDPNVDVALRAHPSAHALEPTNPADPDPVPDRPRGARSPTRSANRTTLEVPTNWSGVTASWTGTLTPPRTGLYGFSIAGSGSATLSLDGVPAVSDPETHVRGVWSQSVRLTAGHPYQVLLSWSPLVTNAITSQSQLHTTTLTLGWEYASAPIAEAVIAARSSKVAVVFAGDYSSEGFDRPSLNLPGNENALIAAVAAVNPRTVVVLNTGNPVLMPWLGQVAGVIEDWYPGEEDGDAIAAVLFGHVDPSGRLPVTFPTSAAQLSTAQWPGVNLVSTYSEGLQVGYRYDNANGLHPLFSFGFGLSYTHFTHRLVSTTPTGAGWVLRVRVTNTGKVAGTDVPQAYLTFPATAHEPPAQLAAFQPVTLQPGGSAVVALTVPSSAFASYQGSRWTTVPGTYTLAVGESSQNLLLHTTVQAG
jgi:beta-glucosidase